MATDTWWHGQKLGFARMGEPSCPTVFKNDVDVVEALEDTYEVYRIQKFGRRNSRPNARTTLLRSYAPERLPSALSVTISVLLAIILLVSPSNAAFVKFENCLGPSIINSNNPQLLQFVPLYVWATLNSSAPSNSLNVTVYGNVTGLSVPGPYPLPDAESWADPKNTTDKIPDLGGPPGKQLYTTFETQFNVLSYTPYNPPDVRFCNSSSLTPCPIAPVFNTTATE